MELIIDLKDRPNDVKLVVLRGEIGTDTVNKLKESLDSQVDSGTKNLIINFQDVNYLNSMGLGVIAATLKKVRKEKGDLKLIKLSPAVQELFELTRLTKIFKIFTTEEEALNDFA
ncbi:STAS domain-containing protein [Candidatus Riflebacteria bacterium]